MPIVPALAAEPRFYRRYAATPVSVGVIRREMVTIARECGVGDEHLGGVRLAVSEAATNAVVHGSAGRDAQIGVRVALTASEMLVTIRDDGAGFMPNPGSPGMGAGLFIVAAITGRLDLRTSPEGTAVHMAFPLTGTVTTP